MSRTVIVISWLINGLVFGIWQNSIGAGIWMVLTFTILGIMLDEHSD